MVLAADATPVVPLAEITCAVVDGMDDAEGVVEPLPDTDVVELGTAEEETVEAGVATTGDTIVVALVDAT